ncbi:MAG TPA: hypothetical protein PK264_15785, partial [Hyphomicrobiaceae bacterium]|nr:hypothetical protein [Hyphomicrobiaceae bacterium]
MLRSLRLALSVLALSGLAYSHFATTSGRAEEPAFAHPGVSADATALEAVIKALAKTGTGQATGTKSSARPTRATAEALLKGGDAAGAVMAAGLDNHVDGALDVVDHVGIGHRHIGLERGYGETADGQLRG